MDQSINHYPLIDISKSWVEVGKSVSDGILVGHQLLWKLDPFSYYPKWGFPIPSRGYKTTSQSRLMKQVLELVKLSWMCLRTHDALCTQCMIFTAKPMHSFTRWRGTLYSVCVANNECSRNWDISADKAGHFWWSYGHE